MSNVVGKLGQSNAASVPVVGDDQQKPAEQKLKPCCACPETRKKRDECIVENGEVNCTEYIDAHKECLRSLGFKV